MATRLRKPILDLGLRNWVSASPDGGPGLPVKGSEWGSGGRVY